MADFWYIMYTSTSDTGGQQGKQTKRTGKTWGKPFLFHVRKAMAAEVWCSAVVGAECCPQGRQEKRQQEMGLKSLPNQASVRLWATLHSASLIYKEISRK